MSGSGSYVVPDSVRPARADKALATAFPEHSRSAFQRAFDAGLVTRRGARIGRDASLAPGETVEFSFPDTAPSELRAVRIRLEVLFEDKWLIAVNKSAGMVVHPGAGTGEDTLVHALLAHCKGSLSGIGGVERPGIVHRLDRETSGVIIVAKTDAAHTALAAQFAERTATKDYCALVAGVPRLLSGSVTKSIGRNPRHRHKMAAFDEGHGGRPSRTDWAVAERFGGSACLVSCELYSGRTHQIRVHMASLGHPILGDSIYGWRPDKSMKLQPARTMLHAARLVVAHPKSGKRLELKAPFPADFKAMIRALRKE